MKLVVTGGQRARVAFAIVVAFAAALTKWFAIRSGLNLYADFDELWVGARALLAGHSPYVAVTTEIGRWPLFYPIYAVAAHVPFVAISLAHARIAYIAIGAFGFALAITHDGWDRWPAVLSAAFVVAIANGQWSPLLVTAVVFPSLSFLLVSKPTTGGALIVAYAPQLVRRRAFWLGLAIAVVLAVIGTLIDPRWLVEWLAVTRNKPQVRAPVGYVPWLGLPVILLALLRWRRPEARMIALLTAMPHSFRSYELLPLFLVPTTQRQSIILALGTWVAELLGGFVTDFPEAIAYQERHAVWYLSLVYAPCVVMVLMRRNQGELPSVLETMVARWPKWLRGELLTN